MNKKIDVTKYQHVFDSIFKESGNDMTKTIKDFIEFVKNGKKIIVTGKDPLSTESLMRTLKKSLVSELGHAHFEALIAKDHDEIVKQLIENYNEENAFTIIDKENRGTKVSRLLKERSFKGVVISYSIYHPYFQAQEVPAHHFTRKGFFFDIKKCICGECECKELLKRKKE